MDLPENTALIAAAALETLIWNINGASYTRETGMYTVLRKR